MKNKKVKIPLIVGASVVGAVLVAVIVLCAVTVRPMHSFMNYSTVRVTTSEHTLPSATLSDKGGEFRKKIDKNLKDTGFSVMHATLEFVGNYGPQFLTEKNDEDETVQRKLTIDAARSECAATADSYKLELEFDTEQTYKVGKTSISYDRMMMNVKTTDGELRWVTVYLYLSSMDGVVDPEKTDSYRVLPFRVRMNTSPLYIALGEIADDYH